MNHPAENKCVMQAAVDAYAIVDTFAEQAYDDLTGTAAETFQSPMGPIAFLDHDRCWFKSRVGMMGTEAPRAKALCNHLTMLGGEMLVVNDASVDERFRHNPLVTGDPKIRFYAGAPLVSPSGLVLGAICAIDTEPRQIEQDQLETLRFLAQHVIETLKKRRVALGGA